ncbi:glutathione S-transferase L3 isoform X1 [Hevea brasiliensis]|uniref:glutathione S-transferase L3 isoform X1 n=1 Tax=Hevea brasiliensis TaxID=3981 RepID=UPI0025D330BA|nr:glutathione S-transferase L3 isoform X1 [Hevea brasiliensis]
MFGRTILEPRYGLLSFKEGKAFEGKAFSKHHFRPTKLAGACHYLTLRKPLYASSKHTVSFSLSISPLGLDKSVPEKWPPVLEPTAEQPQLFDGTIRLYTAYICPFAQRVWITRNYKGLQDKIKLIPLNLQSRPDWYGEKVCPTNKVPTLEHKGKIIGESLDLIKYLDSNFEGQSLLPDDHAKKEFAEELFAYTDTFNKIVYTSLKGDPAKEAGPAFDYLENALHKFDDGPFLLCQFSLVDIAYIPFVERFHVFLSEVFKYDITAGRPKLAAWIEEINDIEAYKQTKLDPKEHVELFKKRFQVST